MDHKFYMPIREFSRLTGIRRENLRFYDQIGLLTPDLRGENGYRYYNRSQLDSAFLISGLRSLGVGLEEIKKYSSERSPEHMFSLFTQQEERIAEEMERLQTIREIMHLRAEMARKAIGYGENALLLEEKEQEPIFLCPPLETNLTEEEQLLLSYDYAEEHHINFCCPLGTVVSGEALKNGTCHPEIRYYFKVLHNCNAWKPAGKYAVSYGHFHQGDSDQLYSRLLEFIQKQGMKIVGDAYEEYLLDEISAQDGAFYGIRVEIQVAD